MQLGRAEPQSKEDKQEKKGSFHLVSTKKEPIADLFVFSMMNAEKSD